MYHASGSYLFFIKIFNMEVGLFLSNAMRSSNRRLDSDFLDLKYCSGLNISHVS